MSDQETRVAGGELQFDRVVPESSLAAAQPTPGGVVCASCHAAIPTAYYQINGHSVCARCRATLQAAAASPRGIGALLVAGLFGLGAGLAGAAIYYAVIAITNFEIGIVAILIGYMIGYAVRKGAKGRGGRRFQVLAAVLTYTSVAFAYAPIAVREVMAADRATERQVAAAPDSSIAPPPSNGGRVARERPTTARFLVAASSVIALVFALPVIVVVTSLPSGLISGLIIFIGMRQAWKMTGALSLDVQGPFRVGAAPAPAAP